jgi:hypothetical protein
MKKLILTEEEKKRIRLLYETKRNNNILLEYKGQEIPLGMNQIMAFQKWVWTKIDKNPNPETIPDTGVESKKVYKSILCPSNALTNNSDKITEGYCYPWGSWIPCPNYATTKAYCRNPNNGAVTGFWGPKSANAWTLHSATYKKQVPNWDVDDQKLDTRVQGVNVPTTPQATKNFQRWYMDKIEKQQKLPAIDLKDPSKNILFQNQLYNTKLCASPCKYWEAVDGKGMEDINSRTRQLWDTYNLQYKQDNKNFVSTDEWSLEIQAKKDVEEREKTIANNLQKNIKGVSPFWIDRSGKLTENTTDSNPVYENLNNKNYWFLDKSQAEIHYKNFGWDFDVAKYPSPKDYKEEDFNKMLLGTKYVYRDSGLYYASDTGWVNNNEIVTDGFYDFTTETNEDGTTKRGETYWVPSDTQGVMVAKRMLSFNRELLDQANDIPIYCTAIKSPDIKAYAGNNLGIDTTKNLYIRADDACRYAGGLWVYNINGNKFCGCRDMTVPYLKKNTEVTINRKDDDSYASLIQGQKVILKSVDSAFQYKEQNDYHFNEGKDWARLINDVMPYIAIPMAIFGGPLGFASAELATTLFALDLIDAAAYKYRGDDFGAGLALMFGIIGSGDMIRRIPGVEDMIRSAGGVKKFGSELAEATRRGDPAELLKYKEVMEGIAKNGQYFKNIVDGKIPNLKVQIKAKAAELKNSGVLKQTTKAVGKTIIGGLAKMTLDKLVKFIVWMAKSDDLFMSLIRNAGIQIGGSFLGWDAIAYYMGICNTMSTEGMDEMLKKINELKEKPLIALTTDEKLMVQEAPWKLTVSLAKGMNYLQPFSEPCKKIEVWDQILIDLMANKELRESLENESDNFNSEVTVILNKITENLTSPPALFDPRILAVQIVLDNWVSNTPTVPNEGTTGNKGLITSWGFLKLDTINIIKDFQKYSDLPTDGNITVSLKDKMITFINNFSGTLVNNSGISFQKEKIESLVIDSIERARSLQGPNDSKVKIVEGTASDYNNLSEEEKKNAIEGGGSGGMGDIDSTKLCEFLKKTQPETYEIYVENGICK